MGVSDCGASHATMGRSRASLEAMGASGGLLSCPAGAADYSAPPAAFPLHARSSPMPTTYDVLGIGNAIVDVIARTEDDFLVKHGMHKGTMALIDEARAEGIYASMGPAIE